MKNLDCLVRICTMYQQQKYPLTELQSRIITAPLPDHLSKDVLKELEEFDNAIEEILYCKNEEDWEQCSKPVIDRLIHAVRREQQK